MKIRRTAIWICLFCLLAGSSGCSQFRKFFSRDPQQAQERRNVRRTRTPDDDDRDPIRDMFKTSNPPSYIHNKNLTPQERALLREELHSNDPGAAKKSFRSNYKDEQKKRQDWVFGR